LLCAITTVFKLIAPAKTSVARSVAASLRDIRVPPGQNEPGEHSIRNYTYVKRLARRTCTETYISSRLNSSPGFRPRRRLRERSCRHIVGSRPCTVNGTVVLDMTSRAARNSGCSRPLDTSAPYFVAWKIACTPA
jgi:hypothetical protein